MKSWTPNVRTYPHFDALISPKRAAAIATDPKIVAAHKFYPFLKYDERWTRFAKKGIRGKAKERPIRFAARLDSCIFSYYRHLLSEPYEQQLAVAGLAGSVLAYRRVPKATGSGGQCNIDFALSAFEAARGFGNCCTVALDISSFFESLDHDRLRTVWGSLIGYGKLPDDHFKVFESVTRYAFVDVKAAYERLGYFGQKKDRNGKLREGYLVAKKDIPVQLCDGRTFRAKIAGTPSLPSIIQSNKSGRGVPQGAPLSDLLANAYLLDFDRHVKGLCDCVGAQYFRYSDDILIVAPITPAEALSLELEVRTQISTFGAHLEIKEEKSAVHQFVASGSRQIITAIKPSATPNKPFEYLGFRYDGRYAYIRDKTMSGLHRKVASVCRSAAIRLTKRYAGKSEDDLFTLANLDKLIQAFGPVEDFYARVDDYRSWTFTTYAKRASKTLGPLGKPISRQLRGLRGAIQARFKRELSRLAE